MLINVFPWEFTDNLLWYSPYQKYLPAKQACLLSLWDELGVPHEPQKQVFSHRLTIIGFDVDPNTMTFTMPLLARSDLCNAICDFAKPGQRRSLREFQQLAGWANWSFNVYPLLHPGLSIMYNKMASKSKLHQLIWVSVSLC